jgi:hypothetical protein
VTSPPSVPRLSGVDGGEALVDASRELRDCGGLEHMLPKDGDQTCLDGPHPQTEASMTLLA